MGRGQGHQIPSEIVMKVRIRKAEIPAYRVESKRRRRAQRLRGRRLDERRDSECK